MKQKQLIFNFFVNRNWKKLTDSRKRAKILADNRKSHHPIETLHSGSYTMMAKPISPMIQFLITANSPNASATYYTYLLEIMKGSFILSLINLFISVNNFK